MADLLAAVLRDLAAESEVLDALVAPLDVEAWRSPTPAEGWDVAMQIAHLAWTDTAAIAAAGDADAWQAVVAAALADPDQAVDTAARAGAASPTLLADWRSGRASLAAALRAVPPGQRISWFGPPMSATSMATARFMETWAHGQDVADALGVVRAPTDRLRHVAHLGVRTRDFAFANRGLTPPTEEFSVTLVSPSEEVWTWGPPEAAQTVTGSALDFCLLVTQRRARGDLDVVAVGADADRWLDVAQAFAGPPGKGRHGG
ncbi:TIGR03084 family protein [Nocardioides mangrovicus]|uniref:TIGR03084 family protein n=1 Tax=Nocardioides mangrovicus TaxID=2478913 RepID=A0A3L8NZI8_9ACTN|nr:TIGR03084 family metal-binding protein [Nocardioides mangrovicus]RLV48191.1 TIGR03084 family protein [Nocardioides mangrovicus]